MAVKIETVDDLREELSTHADAGMALQVQSAVGEAISRKLIKLEDALTREVLVEVMKMIHELNKAPDAMTTLFSFIGKTSNSFEAALQFVECKMRLLQGRNAA